MPPIRTSSSSEPELLDGLGVAVGYLPLYGELQRAPPPSEVRDAQERARSEQAHTNCQQLKRSPGRANVMVREPDLCRHQERQRGGYCHHDHGDSADPPHQPVMPSRADWRRPAGLALHAATNPCRVIRVLHHSEYDPSWPWKPRGHPMCLWVYLQDQISAPIG